MSFCPKCGTAMPDGARFCPSCGTKAADRAVAPSRIEINGDTFGQVYVYVPKPLKKVRPGDVIWVTPVLAGKPMKSKLTKTTWSEADSPGTVALAYNGKQFGMVARGAEHYRRLLSEGHDVVIAAKCTGWYAKGYPELELCGYSYSVMSSWYAVARLTGFSVQPSAINGMSRLFIHSEEYEGAGLVDGEAFWCKIVQVPPAEGSKAKPKMQLLRDDMVLYSCTSRSKMYARYEPYIGRTVPAAPLSSVKEDGLNSWYAIDLFLEMP